MILALMIDSYPSRPSVNPLVYIESLVNDVTVDGFAPCVVARAADTWARSNRFPPSRAEFLDECRKGRAYLENLGDLPMRAADLRDSAERALVEAGATDVTP